MGLFSKIKKLSVFSGFFSIDEDFFEELEESLILADMGMDTTMEAVEELRTRVKERKLKDPEEVKACLREILVEMLNVGDPDLDRRGYLPGSCRRPAGHLGRPGAGGDRPPRGGLRPCRRGF